LTFLSFALKNISFDNREEAARQGLALLTNCQFASLTPISDFVVEFILKSYIVIYPYVSDRNRQSFSITIF